MPSNLVWLDDALSPLAVIDFGTIDAGDSGVVKTFVRNAGTTTAPGVVLKKRRYGNNDGADYMSSALDDGTNNPGDYTADDVLIGDVAAGTSVAVWLKTDVLLSVTRSGNPRQAEWILSYYGA